MDKDYIDEARHFFVYTPGSKSVAIVQGTAGLISCIIASTLFLHLAVVTIYPLIQRRLNGVSAAIDGGENNKLKTQVSIFLMALFAGDMFQSLCGMMQLRWASMGGVMLNSAACRAQGVALLSGDLIVCWFNIVMAVHTFLTIVMRVTMNTVTTTVVVIAGFLLSIIFALIGPFGLATEEKGPFYGLAGIWCFIRDPYAGPRVWLHYLPLYISIFTLLVIYIAVFWKLRNRERTSQRSGTLSTSQRATGVNTIMAENPGLRSHYNKVANKLMWYPTSYLCLVLPISIGRVVQIGGNNLPAAFMNAAICILMLSGAVNGLIYLFTRKALSPFSSWAPQRKPDLAFLKRRDQPQTYAVWVSQEQQQNTPGDDKFTVSVELSDSIGKRKGDPETGSF